MPDFDDWPLPAALDVQQTLLELTEQAGLYLNDDDFDTISAETPHLMMAWISAAARYAGLDYQLQLLHRPIGWMRDEISPASRYDIDEIGPFVDQLHGLLKEHQRLTAAQAEAHRAFTTASKPLIDRGLLDRDGRQWRETWLIAAPLTTAALVHVPQDDCAPWPRVKAGLGLLEQLAEPKRVPEPGMPVVRRALSGFVRLDHDGSWQRLLPGPDGSYWLRGFAWNEPAAPDGAPTSSPAPAPTAG